MRLRIARDSSSAICEPSRSLRIATRRQVVQCVGEDPVLGPGSRELDRVTAQRHCFAVRPHDVRDPAEPRSAECDAVATALGLEERARLDEHVERHGRARLAAAPCDRLRTGPGCTRLRVATGGRKRIVEAPPCFGDRPARLPVPPECGADAERQVGPVHPQPSAEGRPDVRLLGVERAQPRELVMSAELVLRALGKEAKNLACRSSFSSNSPDSRRRSSAYSRSDSSIEKRPFSRTIRFFSTSDSSVDGRASQASTHASPVKPPVKTDSLANSWRSRRSSRS